MVVVVLVVVLLSGVGLTVVEVVVVAGVVVVVVVVVLSAAFVVVVGSVVLVVVDGVVVLASGAAVDVSGITGDTLEPSCTSLLVTSKQETATTANASTTFRNCEGDISPNSALSAGGSTSLPEGGNRSDRQLVKSGQTQSEHPRTNRRRFRERGQVDDSRLFPYSKTRKLEMERN